jgi:hypothetical protein
MESAAGESTGRVQSVPVTPLDGPFAALQVTLFPIPLSGSETVRVRPTDAPRDALPHSRASGGSGRHDLHRRAQSRRPRRLTAARGSMTEYTAAEVGDMSRAPKAIRSFQASGWSLIQPATSVYLRVGRMSMIWWCSTSAMWWRRWCAFSGRVAQRRSRRGRWRSSG